MTLPLWVSFAFLILLGIFGRSCGLVLTFTITFMHIQILLFFLSSSCASLASCSRTCGRRSITCKWLCMHEKQRKQAFGLAKPWKHRVINKGRRLKLFSYMPLQVDLLASCLSSSATPVVVCHLLRLHLATISFRLVCHSDIVSPLG
jgi:hypothetical protein